ncbi:apolipoprotein D-like [Anastrepha obliqua]|uniref:apolipoprotein D-like n=1 Tax=Anastrepha obliqua TaxID=95512 RepID=UPI002408F3FA|nr:apolipoprotein D-like [Anastrepha obliqua]
MQKQLTFVCLLAIFLGTTQMVASQIIGLGRCPRNIKTVEDFDATKYLGTWYEYSKYPFIFEFGAKCVTAEYGAINSTEISVVNTQISSLNSKQSIDGIAKIVGPGKLAVSFNGLAALAGAADYWVLATDYENYAVVYSCKNIALTHATFVWILTRERVPSADIINAAKDALVSQNISLSELSETDQSDC